MVDPSDTPTAGPGGPSLFEGRRIIDSGAIRDLLPVGRTTFYRFINQPGFPRPFQAVEGGVYLWWAEEVEAFLRELPRIEPTTAREEAPAGTTSEVGFELRPRSTKRKERGG